MNEINHENLGDYYEAAESWSADRERAERRSRKIAWSVAIVAAVIALVEALALFALVPLRREVPYTLLVDRQTGYVEAIRPLDEQRVTADSALTRSFLVQYVTARESYDRDTLQANYRKVGLWSAGEARDRYLAQMRSPNLDNPVSSLPPGSNIDVNVRSVSSLGRDTAMVRFDTVLNERGRPGQIVQSWAAVIRFRYSDADMSAEDRLTNPLGFQVVRYRKDAETLPLVETDAGNVEPASAAPVPEAAE